MIEFTHETLVGFSKSFGLFYLMALSVGVLVYACWPANKEKFDGAASKVLSDEEGPR
jgi:cytochrome c oxidase cbb3-type subunit 4